MSNKAFKSSLPVMPVLPSLRRSSNGSGVQLPCLCGCGLLTNNRFVSGHDAKVQKAARLLETGYDVKLLGCHAVVATHEVALRAANGVTPGVHGGVVFVTRQSLAEFVAKLAKRTSRKAVEAPVADPVSA